MTLITLEQLQAENRQWQLRNFPNQLPHQPLLGLVEEFGELETAENTEAAEDAIADCAIYLANYCSLNGLVLSDAACGINDIALYRLCHFHLKGEQGIRYTPDTIKAAKQDCVNEIVQLLRESARLEGVSFYQAITKVWNVVKQRNWVANPIDAAKIAEAQA